MARMPGVTWRPLPENATQPRIVPTQFIVHSAADAPGPSNIPGYFARKSVGVESHFWIPWQIKPGEVHKIVQMMDTTRRADANRWANRRAISVETEDEGRPNTLPWNEGQLWALEHIARWVNAEHSIPLDRCPAWDKPGLGYHVMFGSPGPWTPARKTCPGHIRIKQFDDVLLPRLKGQPAVAPPSNPSDNLVLPGSRRATIIEMQQVLRDAGFYDGELDADPFKGTLSAVHAMKNALVEAAALVEDLKQELSEAQAGPGQSEVAAAVQLAADVRWSLRKYDKRDDG